MFVPIWMVDNKFVAVGTVVHDLACPRKFLKREDVCNPLWMVPNHTIAWQISNQIDAGDASGAMDIHVPIADPDVL